jgi:hypothetical protein
LRPLAHPQPAEREAVERQRAQLGEAARALDGVGAALVDAEQRHLPAALVAQPRALVESAPRPAHRPRHGLAHLVGRRGQPDQVVERHGDVRAQAVLHAHRLFGREVMPRAVQVRAKVHALLAHAVQLVHAHHLEAAAVGEDRVLPAHEAVQAAHAADGVDAGPEHQVVGVAEQDVAARGREVVGAQRLDRAGRPDGHERGREHVPVGRAETPGARAGGSV